MEFLKEVWKNKRVLCSMVKNDFVNRFANTSLGAIWGFVSPIVLIVLYAFVFEYILKLNTAGEYPYLVWFLPGIVMWTFLNDAILNTTNSIREYSYLVKKIVFPIDIIPLIKVFSTFIVAAVMLAIVIAISFFNGFLPNLIMLIYYTLAAVFFIIGITRLTSALSVMLGDIAQVVPVIMQLMFWATPTVWNIAIVDDKIANIIKFNPLAYLVCGYRDVFINGSIFSDNNYIFTIVFWIIAVLVFIYGNIIFNKNKDEFSDVI
ncbi:MAG: ABC transporter permease [Clostridia bacterium]